MSDSPIQIEYNKELKPLEVVLSGVKRPGDFYSNGSISVPLPRMDIDGVGTISFPLSESQALQIISQAEQAPYGRGEETLVDTSVRNVWQVSPTKIHMGGTTWAATLESIVSRVVEGLGCKRDSVVAELYKGLLYDKGGFFTAHRDTEKEKGMFGTLVVVLPSFHSGGELIIRHSGREVSLDLAAKDVSEVTYAAFYADCEHEVLPIQSGNRLCLIYNLIQRVKPGSNADRFAAPAYDKQISAISELLAEWERRTDQPPKITYLLEHKYSPEGLAFSNLKNADAALARVLKEAARRAGFSVHLGIVHIEESGAAELSYDPYSYRSRRGRYNDDDEEESDDDFEVIEVSDFERYISEWRDIEDRPVDYGNIPLEDGELLPDGSLDNELPDKQSVMEATGNEGATFERSYRRAALVIWPEKRYPEVLLAAGVSAAIPYLKNRVQGWAALPNEKERRAAWPDIEALVTLVLDAWESEVDDRRYGYGDKSERDRDTMLELLRITGDTVLICYFIEKVITPLYTGAENKLLAKVAPLLGPSIAAQTFSQLLEKTTPVCHAAAVDLLTRLGGDWKGGSNPSEVRVAQKEIATVVVEALSQIPTSGKVHEKYGWQWAQTFKPVNSKTIAALFTTLFKLDAPDITESALEKIARASDVFVPDSTIVPALSAIRERTSGSNHVAIFFGLWKHCGDFLLARSEYPPRVPTDWAQTVNLKCNCEDCRDLKVFAENPEAQIYRFRARQDRRTHIEYAIKSHDLDMVFETDRKGSPQTLVCTKTRRTYKNQRLQYEADIGHLKTCVTLAENLPEELGGLLGRMYLAIQRLGE